MPLSGTLRKLKHWSALSICSWIPVPLWHRLLGIELVVPRYHLVAEREPRHVAGISIFRDVHTFKEDLDFFLMSYVPVGLNDIIDHLDGKRPLPKRCFLMTFDDGFREAHDVIAPALSSKGIPAVFFINPSVIDNRDLLSEQKKCLLIHALREEPALSQRVSGCLSDAGIGGNDLFIRIRKIPYGKRGLLDDIARDVGCDFAKYAIDVQPYLTSEQTQSLIRKGYSVGGHSMDHPAYTELTLDEQLAQTRETIRFLLDRFHYKCETFSFPYWDTDIPPDFFKAIYADGQLKVSFGSDGIHRHFFPRNFERLKMEYPGVIARKIVALEYCQALIRKPWWAGRFTAASAALGI